MRLGSKYRRERKPDAQAFDEIRIVTVPRYKTSGLSGDEWRISASARFFRKGVQVHEDGRNTLAGVAKHLAHMLDKATDEGRAYFAGERDVCDQEGCAEKAVVALAMKKERCCNQTSVCTPVNEAVGIPVRLFCERHRRRGDCDMTDCDANYYEIPMSEILQ